MKVLELKGPKSLRPLNIFSSLCVSMTMVPRLLANHTSAQDMMNALQEMPPEDQAKVLREIAEIAPLDVDEVEALLGFCCDSNGVPYSKVNMKNLTAFQIIDCIVAVCMKVVEMKIHMVSEAEKKNLETSQLTQ